MDEDQTRKLSWLVGNNFQGSISGESSPGWDPGWGPNFYQVLHVILRHTSFRILALEQRFLSLASHYNILLII